MKALCAEQQSTSKSFIFHPLKHPKTIKSFCRLARIPPPAMCKNTFLFQLAIKSFIKIICLYRVPNTLYIWKLSVHFFITTISSVASALHPIHLSNTFPQQTLYFNTRSKNNCKTRAFWESSRVRVLVLFCTVLLHSSTGDKTHLLCITCPCKNHYRNTIL